MPKRKREQTFSTRSRSTSAPAILLSSSRPSTVTSSSSSRSPVVGGTVTPSSSSMSSVMVGKITRPSSLSKYLTLPEGATPTLPKTLPRARLLTSADAMAQVEEKERMKKLALEEKEHKKPEREEKKMQKEEEQKLKAEERLKRQRQR